MNSIIEFMCKRLSAMGKGAREQNYLWIGALLAAACLLMGLVLPSRGLAKVPPAKGTALSGELAPLALHCPIDIRIAPSTLLPAANSEPRRQRWAQRAPSQEEWEAMSPQEREALRRKMREYKQMPSETKELYRKRYEQLQKLPPDERSEVQRKLERWESLSPQEKERIRRKFRN